MSDPGLQAGREPNSLEAEQAVLGAVMADSDNLHIVLSRLTANDFYYPDYRNIYESMLKLAEANAPIDIVSLAENLDDRNLLDKVGGAEALGNLTKYTALYNLNYYIRIVQEKSQLRQLIKAFRQLEKSCFQSEADADQIISLAAQSMQSIRESDHSEGFLKMGKVLVDQINEKMEQLKSNEPFFQNTGFASLDQKLDGLRKGALYILAARPGMGKSALAFNIAQRVASIYEVPTVIFSLEMSAEEVSNRFLSTFSMIDSGKISSGSLSTSEWDEVSRKVSELYPVPIYLYDHAGVGPLEMLYRCRELKLKEPHLGLVIVDYLQLMSSDGRRSDNRQQEISEISRNLKIMARELEVPVLALSQLSRACENRQNKRPLLSDLRDSGAIEQDADVVLFLYRDDYYDQTDEATAPTEGNSTEAELIIAKNRHGETGTIHLGWRPEFTLFYDLDPRRQNAAPPPF